MPSLRLADFEAAPRHTGDHDATLRALQRRLAHAQTALAVHRRGAIVVFEGWAGSGRGGVIRRLAAAMDPRALSVWTCDAPGRAERGRHYLARFWAQLPAAGEIAVFDGSWYGRVLGERVDGLTGRAEWRRSYDEINEFEAQQKDAGTTVVKLFLHISEEEQGRRLARRLADPWQRVLMTPGQFRELPQRAAHVAAVEEMLARTDTRWAPWQVVDAGARKSARLAALTHVAEALEKAVPTAPPEPDPAIMAAARAAGVLVD